MNIKSAIIAMVSSSVGVARQHRVVPSVAELDREVSVPLIERGAVRDNPVVERVHPSVERRARRAAWGGLAVVPGEPDALGG